MLPCLVAACGLVSSSLLHAVETFVAIPHTLLEMKQRRYADAFDYPHLHVDASQGAQGAQIQALYKYESLLDILTRCADDTLVLLLSANAAIVNRVPLASMLADRPYLIVRTESECQQTDVQIWRNSRGNRDVVRNIVRRARLGGERFDGEARLLNELDVLEWFQPIDGVHPVLRAGANVDPLWSRASTFAISLVAIQHRPDHSRPLTGAAPHQAKLDAM